MARPRSKKYLQIIEDRKLVGQRVRICVAQTLGVELEKVDGSKSFISLGADSLDFVELLIAFEEEFEIEIPDSEAEKIPTVGKAIQWLEENMQP